MKLFYSCLNFLHLFWLIVAVISYALAAETTTTTTPATTVKTTNENVVTAQTPIAEKLVRYRRQPPVTIIKHVIRSSKRSKPRRRIKRPKLRYGPPTSFVFDDQFSYYKPQTQFSAATLSPTEEAAQSFHFDDFQHLKLDAADFELPSSSYEAQSMDLDFYSHKEDENSYQHIPKLLSTIEAADDYGGSSSLELDHHNIQSSYTYTPTKQQTPRKPHQKYGLPKNLEYSTDFNASPKYFQTGDYSNYNSYKSQTEESPYDSSILNENNSYQLSDSSASNIPSNQFSIQSHTSHDISASTSKTYGSPKHIKTQYKPDFSNSGTYTVYNNIPNTGYEENYNKPEYVSEPAPTSVHAISDTDYYVQNYGDKHIYTESQTLTPTKPQADNIEFTYSPSYEINLLNHGNQYQSSNEHYQSNNEHPNQPGNFAEPPQQPTETYQTPSQPIVPEIQQQHKQQPGTLDDYVPPTHELPLNPQYKQPAYDFPKSSYEVPIYDPIPFDALTNNEEEYYPPNQYELTNLPKEQTGQQQNNFPTNYKFEQQETIQQTSIEDIPTRDTHASESESSIKLTKKRRRGNRKRQQNPLNSSMKHILDVPELKKAFEASKQNKESHTTRQADADVNASTYIEEKQQFLPTQANSKKEIFHSATWNPKRIRTPTHTFNTQNDFVTPRSSFSASSSSSSPLSSSFSSKHKTQINFRPRPRPRITSTVTTTPFHKQQPEKQSFMEANSNASTNIAIISIEKSRSQSYYDGTLAPPTLKMSNLYNTKLNKFKTPLNSTTIKSTFPKQASPTYKPYKDVPAVKRTTKSIFDATHFKTPQNDRDDINYGLLAQTLPKNHKLF